MTTTDLYDTRAIFRGFASADEYLTLAKRALEHRPYPKWVEREYRAIFGGEMRLPRTEGAISSRPPPFPGSLAGDTGPEGDV